MFPEVISVFGLKISLYGILVALGVVLGYFLVLKLAKREKLDLKAVENSFLLAILFGIVGARIAYAIEHPYEFRDLIDYIAIWKGGVSFYGGLIGGIVGALIGIKIFNLPLWKSADIAAPAIALAHFFGRLGCTSAGCCYGKPFPYATSNEIGIHFTDKFPFFYIVFPKGAVAPPFTPLYPTQLMEALGNLLIFLILLILYRKKPYDGFVFALYLLLYGTQRFLLEFYRGVTPPIPAIGLTWNQIVSIILIIGAVILIVLLRKVQFEQKAI
ncbi:MAG: prolipoprotein diacylglyceryl transferase [Aquifex sp.]|nr:MAG: prolipoprotein diacylglyceryl transferase [Aquifex sp.]